LKNPALLVPALFPGKISTKLSQQGLQVKLLIDAEQN
jgi:hypothetical protein